MISAMLLRNSRMVALFMVSPRVIRARTKEYTVVYTYSIRWAVTHLLMTGYQTRVRVTPRMPLPYRDFYYPLNVFMHILTHEEGGVDYLHYALFENEHERIGVAQEHSTELLLS